MDVMFIDDRGIRPARRNSVVDPTSLSSLSIQDWKMILSGAHIAVFSKDAIILKEGEFSALFL